MLKAWMPWNGWATSSPHPFWLFVGLSVVLMLVSALLAALDVSAVSPATGETIAVRNLLSAEGLKQADIRRPHQELHHLPSAGPDPGGHARRLHRGQGRPTHRGHALHAGTRAGKDGDIHRGAELHVRPRRFRCGLHSHDSAGHDRFQVVAAPRSLVPSSRTLPSAARAASARSSRDPMPSTQAATGGGKTIDPNYVVSPVANYFFGVVSSFVLAISSPL